MATHGVPVGPFPPGADHDAYDRLRRRVLWKLPMGLYVLGSRSGEKRNLMTINWAMQVSMQPKQLAVSIEAAAVTHGLVTEGRCFSLSLIRREQRSEVRRFVKPAVEDHDARTLNGMEYRQASTGAPIPEIALAWLDCEVRHTLGVGSHTLFVGEVVDAGFAQGGAGGEGANGSDGPEDEEVLRMEDTRMSYGG
jgi:flavin reductase (DIM6/NTAB) family NADH-FMN oxidoreductase RutF